MPRMAPGMCREISSSSLSPNVIQELQREHPGTVHRVLVQRPPNTTQNLKKNFFYFFFIYFFKDLGSCGRVKIKSWQSFHRKLCGTHPHQGRKKYILYAFPSLRKYQCISSTSYGICIRPWAGLRGERALKLK